VGTASERARAALDGVQDDPRRSQRTARDILKDDAIDDQARVVALWALGQAHRELNEIGDACGSLRAAIELAASGGDEQTVASIRMSLSVALFTSGDKDGAFLELDSATSRLTGTEQARAVMQRGLLQFQLGELENAVRSFDTALPVLQAGGDRLAETRLRINRAAALTSVGRLRPAEADLLVVQRLALDLDQRMLTACAEHNLGFVAIRRGDVPGALRWYDRARASYSQLADPRRLVAVLEADRCEVFLSAGLTTEALEAATRAVAAHTLDGNEADLADAELLMARAYLTGSRYAEAVLVAQASAMRFARLQRGAWAALAAYVETQARVLDPAAETSLGVRVLDEVVALAAELDGLGWTNEAIHVRTFAARIALEQGDVERARHELEVAAGARHRGPLAQRVQAWYATGLLRHVAGNDAGSRRALDAGLRLIDEARGAVGSSELRAQVAHHGTDLTTLGLELAQGGGRPRVVLAWLERCRALALLTPPVRPPDDETFAAELAALRQARSDARGRIAAGLTAGDAERRVVRIERSVRDRARRASGTGILHRPTDLRSELAELGENVLVEYLQVGKRLAVIVARDGRVSQHDVGRSDGLVDEIDSLVFALHRLTRHGGSVFSRALAARTLDDAGARLGGRLLGPILRRLGERPVVIVPDPSLHRVPWATIPALRTRPFSLGPSLRAYAQASRLARAPSRSSGTLLVAGPGLPGAEGEVARLAEMYPDAQVLVGAEATTDAVCDALGACQLAHLACHGRLRHDSPLFSSLTMYDGELTVYDLERCRRVAPTVILSACYSGLGAGGTGTEVLGLSAALLSLGCATVVAPLAPVSDDAAASVMVALHRGLLRGERPSVALARSSPEPAAGWGTWASWMAFASFGAG